MNTGMCGNECSLQYIPQYIHVSFIVVLQGSDSVVDCIYNNQTSSFGVQASWNNGRRNQPLAPNVRSNDCYFVFNYELN